MTKSYIADGAERRHNRRKKLIIFAIIALVVLVIATVVVRRTYFESLEPVSSSNATVQVEIPQGATVDEIATLLSKRELIRSDWAFRLFIYDQDAASVLQAGTYNISPNMSVNEIVAQLTHGKVVTNLITILPGQSLAQIKQTFVKAGYTEADVDAAFDPKRYPDVPILVDKPARASLEGFLFPESYQKNSSTKPDALVTAALNEMQQYLTPDIRQKFAAQGLSTYQGLILASIVEKEVSRTADRPQVAQVFISRLHQGISLGSDVTAFFGADLDGQPRSVRYDSPYNTRLYQGLPPTPIGAVSLSAIEAVANPSDTDWLFFVTGDDGTTHFSRTNAEHEALTAKYCHRLCE